MTSFAFHLDYTDPTSRARLGRFETPHGVVETPIFMPVGTRGTVKGIWPDELREMGAKMILANTYHLALRPGESVVKDLGGLHAFMNWQGPILTDSGGYQVFSLAELRQMDRDRVVFKSHVDGSMFDLTPARAVQIQEDLGADVIMCLDECPPHDAPAEKMQAAVDRTTRWAALCRDAQKRPDQALFGILQGGTDQAMRERSAEGLLPLDFPGYAIGGLSVGEAPADMYSTLDFTVPLLPEHKPRYLMGVGRPIDIIEAVLRGVDMFDCVMPTRNARNATAFTSHGLVKMRNLRYQRDTRPLDANCNCPTCQQFSRGYLRHLFQVEEMLGAQALTVHNLAYYQQVMRDLRAAIKSNSAQEFRLDHLARMTADP
ncbi:tRNA guanosine(34) transglycosylase Tgt [Planctomicrobium piriforme]|uniref:Queuine tRNA-ribosyltransferase n=1 Tax=Planctomicrobium piriforme TaxID=1576369 RepID=A0A1I3HHG9_9PLAN|nr:tRNA guanosine(34) transglycosylase Tgt [Planctomicrobium piriforme]SFI35027.1 queuine tRNA-ribosyltransferase [Planctomicrobium piriforme]